MRSSRRLLGDTGWPSKRHLVYFVFAISIVLSAYFLYEYSMNQSSSYLMGASMFLAALCITSFFIHDKDRVRNDSTDLIVNSSTNWGYHAMQASTNNGRFNVIDFAHNNKAWNHAQGWKEDHIEIKDFAHNNKAWSKLEEWKKNRL